MADQNELDMQLRIIGADQVVTEIKNVGTAADAAFQNIQSGADAASSAMSGIDASALQDAFKSASSAAETLAQAATQLAQAIAQVNFQQISNSVEAFTAGMQQLTQAEQQSAEAAQRSADEYENLANELSKTEQAADQLGGKIQESSGHFEQAKEKSAGFIETLNNITGTINTVGSAVKAFQNISELFGGLGSAAKSAGEGVKAAGEASRAIVPAITSIAASANTAATGITSLVPAMATMASTATAAGTAITTLGTVLTGIASSVLPLLTAAIEGVVFAIRSLLAALGPIGIALIALGVALTFLINRFSETKVGAESVGQAFDGMAEGLKKARVEAEGTLEGWTKLALSLRALAADTGQTFQQVQAGRDMFEQMGLSAKKFEETQKAISKEIKDFDIGAAFREAAEDYEKAQQKIQRAQQQLLQNEKSILESVKARQSASAISAEGHFDPAQQAISQRLAQIEATEFANRQREAAKALAAGQREAAEAAKKMGENLSETVDKIEQIVKGVKNVSVEGEDADKVMTAFKIAMKEAADGGSNLTAVILKAVAGLDRANALKIGEVFKISEADVDRIQRANGQLNSADEVVKRLDRSFGAIKGKGEVFEDLQRATERTTDAWTRLDQALRTVGTSEAEAKIQAFWERIKAFFIEGAAFLIEKWNEFWASLPLLAEREMVQFKQDWALFWEDIISTAAKAIDTIASYAPRFGKAIGATKDNAAALRDIAAGFRKDAEDAAIDIQRINDKLEAGSAAGTIDFKRSGRDEDNKRKLDDQRKAFEANKAAIDAINLALRALDEKKFDKLAENAKKLADQIKEIDKRLHDVQRSLTEEGLQKGIIDPMTGGPVAGQEEAFDALQQKRLRANREADEAKTKAEEEAAKERKRIEDQAEAERKALEDKKKALEEEAAARKKGIEEETAARKKATDEEVAARKKATDEEIAARKQAQDAAKEPPDTSKSKAAFDDIVKLAEDSAKKIQDAFKNIKIEVGGPEGNPFQSLVDKAQEAVNNISQVFSTMGSSLGGVGIEGNPFQSLTDAAQQAVNDISQVFSTMGETLSQAISSGGGGSGAFQSLIDAAQEAVNQISQLFSTLGESLASAGLASAIAGFGDAFASEIATATQAKDAFIANLDRLIQKLNEAKQAGQGLKDIGGGGGGGGGGGEGDIFAGQTGGLLGGKPGIDTNLGWFSAGEFIMQKRATDFWGVGFMHAINQMRRVDIMRLLNSSHFNIGGLVPLPRSPPSAKSIIPAYASGGSPIAIDLKIGGQSIGTVHTSEKTAAHLQKLSSHAKIVATGALPNWRRG